MHIDIYMKIYGYTYIYIKGRYVYLHILHLIPYETCTLVVDTTLLRKREQRQRNRKLEIF